MRRFLLYSLFLCFAFVAFGQKQKPNMGKEILEFKLKYLAQEMELNPDQQQRFFELYTQMNDEKQKLFRDVKATERKVKNDKDATDADYENFSQTVTNARVRDAEIDRQYDEKFSTFLTKKQIFKMKVAEDQFRKKMMDMRHKKGHKK